MNFLNAVITIFFFFVSTGVHAQTELRLLAVGNSMTWHPPSKALDWAGNWGMAASKQENDYAHVLEQLVKTANPTSAVRLYPRNMSDFEKNPATFDLQRFSFADAFKPTHIIVYLGDNVHAPQYAAFSFAYINALNRLTLNASAKLYCVSTWWVDSTVDATIAAGCKLKGGTYVDISMLSKKPGLKADAGDFKNQGVAMHPSDVGMKEIASAIFEKLK